MPSITQNRMRLARMTGAQALSAVVQAGRAPGVAGGRGVHRALRGGRLRACQRRGRAVAAEPRLPRAQQRAHRAGPRRDLGRPAGGLARHHPRGVLRAGDRRPAGRRAPRDRGRAAHRVGLPREPGRGAGGQGVGRGRRGARRAREARGPAPAAHRGAAGRAAGGTHARRALQRGAREPRPAPRARGARRGRAPARGAARARGRDASHAEAHAPGRRGERRADAVAIAGAAFGWINYNARAPGRRSPRSRPAPTPSSWSGS